MACAGIGSVGDVPADDARHSLPRFTAEEAFLYALGRQGGVVVVPQVSN